MELENIALNDPYFIEKKLYPNVDFYSGIILKAMDLVSDVHRHFRNGTYRWLDRPLERNAQ